MRSDVWKFLRLAWAWPPTERWRRPFHTVLLGVLIVSIAAPIASYLISEQRYALAADTVTLIGKSDPSLASKVTFDNSTGMYDYNLAAVASQANDPNAAFRNQTGATASEASQYALTLPQNLNQGVTYTDVNTDLSFTLTPTFSAEDGRQVQGHMVYPVGASDQAIYTLKNNGLKEDIVVPQAQGDTLTFNYTLNLPDTLQAKLIPGSGAVGIYSADPSLFGNISFGTSADQAKVLNARTVGPKTNLVFAIPAPIIKETTKDGPEAAAAPAHFALSGNSLTVIASNLSKLSYPITIDPSVVVTSTSDFGSANANDGDISFAANQINRADLTGGSLGAWGSPGTDNSGDARDTAVGIAYNGFMYIVGGLNSTTVLNTVYMAAINSNGTLGTWSTTATLVTAREYLGAVAYNGYLYAYGGYGASSALSSVEYTPINASTGALTGWTTSSNAMVTGVCRFGYAAYNGYVYATEGATSTTGCGNSSTVTNNVQFAPFLATGDVGTWADTTASLSTLDGSGRHSNSSVAYNGYLYIVDGTVNGTGGPTSVFYGHMGTNGDITAWAATTSTPSSHYRFGITVIDGYIYMGGGLGGGFTNDVTYTQINGDGTLGDWYTTSSFTTGRWGQVMMSYNGFVYINGGTTGTPQYDTQYAAVDPAGAGGQYVDSGTSWSTNNRRGMQEVAYNGFLYVMGGDAGTAINTIDAATINSDGSIGAFTATGMTAFNTNRTFFGAAEANGNMYVLGGCTSTFATCSTATNNVATVYMAAISGTGTIGTWSAQTSFTTARYGLQAVAYNNYMYIMGGLNGSTYEADVQYQAFGAGGVLTGTWTTATSGFNLPVAKAMFGATVYGGYLYIAGGIHSTSNTACNGTASLYCSDVQYIQLDGTSAPFISTGWTSSTSFTTARDGEGLFAANGILYIAGGFNGTTYFADTQSAPLNTNGSVGTWTTSSNSVLVHGAYGIGATTYNGNIYVSGGYNGTTYYNTTQIAPLNNGGSGNAARSGTWTTNGINLPGVRTLFGITVYNDYIYVEGGCSTTPTACSGFGGSISYAAIAANGSVGSWTNTAGPVSVYGDGLVAAAGYLYQVGGNVGFPSYSAAVYSTPLNSTSGAMGSWTSQTTTLGTGLMEGSLTYNNGYLYYAGGYNGSNSSLVQYATASAGTVGTWSTTTALPAAAANLTTLVNNGYMYLMGLSTTNDQTYYSAINVSNGTLGSWVATTQMISAESGAAAAVYDGYLYVFGGYNGSTYATGVQYAPMNANGTLGNWSITNSFGTGRNNLGALANNGYVYIMGGGNASTIYQDIQYAPLDSVPRIGNYSKLVDLGGLSSVQSITYNGMLPAPDGVSKANYELAPLNGILTSESSISSLIATGAICGTGGASARYVWVDLTLDDSFDSAYPDTLTSNANVTDFTVNYFTNLNHPLPSVRLRGGKSFAAQAQLPLDTCGA